MNAPSDELLPDDSSLTDDIGEHGSASGVGLIDPPRPKPKANPESRAAKKKPGLEASINRAVSHGGEDGEPSIWDGGLDWPVVIYIALMHIGALAAPFYFTWGGLAIFVGLSVFTGMIGVTLGYHRQLTHGSFMTYRPVRWFLAWAGGMSGEGSALTWVANHRKHHAHSDKEGDPHSPRHGKWWSHMLWFMPNFGQKWHDELTQRYAPDLLKDPVMVFLHKTFLLWHIVTGVVLFAIGSYWNTYTGISFLVWGLFVRMVYVLHVTWCVNSATHLWGYRNYETTDDSRNLWWVAALAFGEGWHNNHHAYQRMARHGHRWWEFDMTYWVIWSMEKVGLAWNVVKKVPPNQKPD
jgi:fatty-acid desaturase